MITGYGINKCSQAMASTNDHRRIDLTSKVRGDQIRAQVSNRLAAVVATTRYGCIRQEEREMGRNEQSEQDFDVSRRNIGSALLSVLGGAIGLSMLEGCAGSDGGAELAPTDPIGTASESLSGATTVVYADVITDLRALSGTTTTIAILKGASAIFDGGGGVFVWSTTAAADDGWAVLNAGSGNTAGWRRVAANVASIANVTSLRATVGTAGALAVLTGYSTAGDGGGGLFCWSTTALQDDGGTIFNSAAGNTAGWRRMYSGGLDVRWFGARGDTNQPQDQAIQLAINAAYSPDPNISPQKTGRTVLLPAGIYQLASPLMIGSPATNAANGLIFKGEGWHSVLVPQTGVAAAIVACNPWGALRDFSIQAGGTGATVAGIVMKEVGNSRIVNVYINRCAGDGMAFDNLYATSPSFTGNNDNASVESCVVTNCGGYGIQLKPSADNNAMAFRNCQVQVNGKAGLLIRGHFNRVEGGDWSANGGPAGIVLSDPADTSYSSYNVLLYPYTDSMVNTVYNAGMAQQNTILLAGGSGEGTSPAFSGVANGHDDMVITQDWKNSNGSGLAFVINNSNPARGLKVTAASALPLTQVYAEGDPNIALWLYSKGTGGIAFGFYADPFQAQFSKTKAVSGLAVPAGGIATVAVPVANNNSPVSVKVGDVATASFNTVLPAGVYIRSVEVTAAATVTVTFQNSSATAQSITGAVRVQVTIY
jgi:hypothetical protein